MKMVKSLILGSAAGLIAMSGAQAADLPVKAKAVEYVRICSLYGAGFYYIPGTDTCIKLGGYLRVETAFNTNSVYNGQYNGLGGAHNRLSNYWTSRSREDFNIDTRTATEYGVLRTYFNATFSWTSGGFAGSGAGLTGGATTYAGDAIAGGFLGVYNAFIQFAGFTMGKAVSQFDAPWVNYPANNFDGLVGGSGFVTAVNQFTYTWQFGNGVSATFSAQDPTGYSQAGVFNLSGATPAGLITGVWGSHDLAANRSPDLIATIQADQAWGTFKGSFVAHQNVPGYYGATEPTGHADAKWGWAVQGALSLKNLGTGAGDTLNLQAVYTDGASRYNFQSLAILNYAMYSGTGLAGAYQSIGLAHVSDAVFVAGSGLENVKTWGFRGGFNHNWDPYWNTGIYGAYAAVNYGNLGTLAVCNNLARPAVGVGTLGLAHVGTCNPDFNIAQAGIITRWTPVKNLTFSGEFTWTRLDQKNTGTVLSPTVAAVAKPGLTYELRDQDSYNFHIRAQRNW